MSWVFSEISWSKNYSELYVGVGNQDVNNSFNDFTMRFGMVYNVFTNSKNQIDVNTGIGIYLPKNDYYSGTVPVVNAGSRYTRFIGAGRKHCLLIDLGYRYGKMNYKQVYSSELLNAATIGTFKVSPVYFSVGYGYRLK